MAERTWYYSDGTPARRQGKATDHDTHDCDRPDVAALNRFPGAWRADATVYTQEDLGKIAQALQRPLSEVLTQQLQERAYEFRWRQASPTERKRLAQERQVYSTLLTHLQAIEKVFDSWNKSDQLTFAQRWHRAAPRSASPADDAYKILQMLSQYDQMGQSLQRICEVVLTAIPRVPKKRAPKKRVSKPLDMFIRQLAYLYHQETGDKATAYDHYQSPFEKFVAACVNPFGLYCSSEDKDSQYKSSLYKAIQRALKA